MRRLKFKTNLTEGRKKALRDEGRGGMRFPALKYRAKVIPPLRGEDAANGNPGPGRTDPKWRSR